MTVAESNNDKIICRIADLVVDIPAAGDMLSRCDAYIETKEKIADIVIEENRINYKNWSGLSNELIVYMETCLMFYYSLLQHEGMLLHSAAVELDDKAFLFSGPCGIGKSTHSRLWKDIFEERAILFNDDKPALRKIDNEWFAYGTPWCGKDGINQNRKVPLAGICFLKKGTTNAICRLTAKDALHRVLAQTTYRFKYEKNLDLLLFVVEQLVREIPIYELTNNATPESAILSYETMRKGAEEAGL